MFAIAAVGLAFVVIGAIWLAFVGNPEGGGQAVAVIDGNAISPPGSSSDKTGAIARPAPTESGAGLIEVIPDGELSEIGADAIIIRDASGADPIRLAAAPIEDLAEESPFGLLPRIGTDGERPMDAYARPTGPDSSGRRIAIIVGGIGINESGTDAAIESLPGTVTLALAPYGKDLPRTLARARAAGHEILLQIPLEPFGYPNNDPGPHTLTVAASAEENLERLHWLMSQATTYVGVMNFLGARFTSEETALEPVITEIGNRGLLYFDDGSSGMSRADTLAKGRAPFARADAVLDALTEAKAIDDRLAEVEAIARRRGYAIATATAFPITIERIAEFAKSAADRGIEIVPLTALVDPGRT